jgi:hypothetical protein
MQHTRDLRHALALGCGVFALAMAAYALAIALFDSQQPVLDPAAPLHLHRLTRINLVLAAIAAFTLAASRYERRAGRQDLRALRPILTLESDGPDASRDPGEMLPPRRAVAAPILGALFGLVVRFATPAEDFLGEIDDTTDWVRLVFGIALFALLGDRVAGTVRSSRRFSQLGRDSVRIDLFDPEPRKVFARRGLRPAISWFVGSAIASLLVLDVAVPALVMAIITVTLSLGVLVLVMPMRGIHAAVRAAKAAELRRTRAAIASGGEALFAGPDGSDSPRLEALIAYEARVEAVREWPIDGSTLLRFAALALLATGSWVGGAIVERAISTLLE